ncbi:MAG: hypothetical protein AAB882_00890 [Patescibacteria group bacterium]
MDDAGADLCPHCDPYPNKASHLHEKIENVLFPLVHFFINPFEATIKNFPRFNEALKNFVGNGVLKTLLICGVLKEVGVEDSDDGLYNRSLVVAREARHRGIEIKAIKFLGVGGTNNFSIGATGNKNFFEGLPHITMGHTSRIDFDDKSKFKKLLEEHGAPHARGDVFHTYALALQYVQKSIGFPAVVKPRSGSLSKHTTCRIKNEVELLEAIRIAKIISNEFIVEEFIPGDVHRITLVGGTVVASCLRKPPNVIGDGTHSVEELIEQKNKDPRRGPINKRNFTLHTIPTSNKTVSVLASQNLTLTSILANDRKVYLHDKVILGCGADIHDTTDTMHLDNISLFEKVGALCAEPVIGIDFIASDISRSYLEQKCAILEANSLPYIDMHHYPVTGHARDVAGAVLDHWISSQPSQLSTELAATVDLPRI